jgi:hypothetical protein
LAAAVVHSVAALLGFGISVKQIIDGETGAAIITKKCR